MIVILKEMKRFALVLAVLSALATGCTESNTPQASSLVDSDCGLPSESEQAVSDSDFVLTITPNPVAPGAEADLVIEFAEDAPEELINTPEGEIITGAGARLQCWDGSTWVDTHQLLKDGFGPDNAPAAIGIGPDVTVTIPAVGLVIEDQPYTIVTPDLPSGIYRVEDTVIVGSSGRSVFSLIEVEND